MSVDFATVDHALDTNLVGAWRTAVAFLPLLRRSAHPRIVNVSSQSGSLASMGAGTPAYAVSKAGLNALTRVLAAELRSERILVNSVCPGWVATDMGGPGGRPVAEGAALDPLGRRPARRRPERRLLPGRPSRCPGDPLLTTPWPPGA